MIKASAWLLLSRLVLAQNCGHSSVEPQSTQIHASQQRTMFPIYGGAAGRIGFIDSRGRVVVPPQFRRIAGWFQGGLMAVAGPGDREGYMDASGAMKIRLPGDSLAEPFSERLAAVRADGKYGYIDTSGKMVIGPAFQTAGEFHLGLAPVRVGGKHGFVNAGGKLPIEPQFQWAGEFSESDGLAAVDYCGECGYINLQGNAAFPQRFWRCYQFAGGIAKVEVRQGRWGYVTRTGQLLGGIEPSAFAEGFLAEGLAAAMAPSGRIGFLNPAGEWVVAPKYAAASPFSEGLAAVSLNGKWGFVDRSGRMVIPPTLGDPEDPMAARFHNGLAFMANAESGKYGFIDRTGKWAIPPRFARCQEQYGYGCGFHGALAQVETATELQYVDKTGRVIWRSRVNGR